MRNCKDLSYLPSSFSFPLVETVYKHFGGPGHKEYAESAHTKEALLGVGRFIECQLHSLGLNRGSTAEDFQRTLGKEYCNFLGSFYSLYIEPVLAYEGFSEERDILVPSTSEGSSSEDEIELQWHVLNSRRDCQVPSLRGSKVPQTLWTESDIASKESSNMYLEESSNSNEASVKYKGDTEISFARIFQLGSVCHPENSDIAPESPYYGPPVLTMSGFGELGRFGNQVIQYMFLKCCAMVHHVTIQIPPWIGESLFCIRDSRVTRRFPAVVERSDMKANSTFTDTFMNYIKASNNGRDVIEIGPDILDSEVSASNRVMNVDVWGWFQWHTSNYGPFRSFIYDCFRVKPDLKAFLDSEINQKLCPLASNSTLVGIHIRLGDYKDISASSFGYCAPIKWYLEWLESMWPKLNNPVLFVASDEIDRVEKEFASFNPKTCRSLGIEMPKNYQGLGADFFPDWYILTQCNVLAISNSTFSFTACLLNQRENSQFYRAHYADRIVQFDPWDSDPVIHREESNSIWKNVMNSVKLVYEQEGSRAALKNIFLQLPLYGFRSLIMRTVLILRRKQLGGKIFKACLFRKRKLNEDEADNEHERKRLRAPS
jgi:hypothetical protein